MRHRKIVIAAVGLAAVAVGGGATAASVSGSSARGSTSAGQSVGAETVHTASATVGGTTETILVNAKGRPLYFYRPDTATKSLVTGGLARLWPPLISAAPTGAGLTGKLTVEKADDQVAYNGHFLYTFISDVAGQVSGQGVRDFFVATPGIAPIAPSEAPANTNRTPASGGGYGY